MSNDELIASDTPEDHFVIALEVEVALLPEWYEAIEKLAAEFSRRMAVMEHPETWRIRIELPKDRGDAFREQLQEAWDGFVATRREEGRWP